MRARAAVGSHPDQLTASHACSIATPSPPTADMPLEPHSTHTMCHKPTRAGAATFMRAEAGRPRSRTRSVMVDVACLAARTVGVPEATMASTLRATRLGGQLRQMVGRPSAQRYSIVRLPPSLQPELAQPPNESVGRLALRRGGVAALRPNVASSMSPLMPQLSAK